MAHRLGKLRAIVAVSHSVLVIIYHLLRTNQDYHDLGPHYFQTLDTTRQRDWAVRRLQALGYTVSLEDLKEEGASSICFMKQVSVFPAQDALGCFCAPFSVLTPFPKFS